MVKCPSRSDNSPTATLMLLRLVNGFRSIMAANGRSIGRLDVPNEPPRPLTPREEYAPPRHVSNGKLVYSFACKEKTDIATESLHYRSIPIREYRSKSMTALSQRK